MISQSDKIFAAILIAFLIYITIRGQLPGYLDLFVGKGTSAPSGDTSGNGSSSSNPLGGISSAISTITNVVEAVAAFFP